MRPLRIHEYIKDLLFPPRCAICDGLLAQEEMKLHVCSRCRKELKYVQEPYCMKCGAPLKDPGGEYCSGCEKHRHYFDRGRSLYVYGSVRSSLYRFKYGGRKEYAEFYGRDLARCFGRQLKEWGVEAIIPIPLHPARQRRRGYNQAAAVAEVLSACTGVPLKDKLLKRSRNTGPQKKLSARERQINLKNAFNITQDVVQLGTVVVVDDIYTTGATMDEAALALKRKGIDRVYFLALATGTGDKGGAA
ncbi:MAG: ComF family protein [Lachnospiraceae bacterium]|nr:ComF family protein [Lachnospiraceae bacterium]